MFQSFDSAADPTLAAGRVKRLRALMQDAGLAALIVPRADEHQDEYVAPSADRLRWLTGFSGSAGLAAVARRHAAVFVDGRYRVQVRAECDGKLFEFPGIAREHLAGWLAEHVRRGESVGFDPWLHTTGEIERLDRDLARHGITLKPTPKNLVDRVWHPDRPSPPTAPIVPHPLSYAGRSSAEKLTDVRAQMKDAGHDALVLALPDSIAWTFNIRGADVAHNPVVLAFALIPATGKAEIFVDPAKVTREARAHLEPVARLSPPKALRERMKALRAAGKRVGVDPERSAYWFGRTLGKGSFVRAPDPTLGLKAVKNATEIAGARAAHVRDGAALARFLAWLDAEAPSGKLDEITVATRLEETRAASQALKELSFDTISGSGPNAAIVHYRVTTATNRKLRQGELFLLDSGAQYQDGTTDVTRTIAIGRPTDEMRTRATAVLKGHIAIAMARFPVGTRGIDLDPFARRALWDLGLDYDHGTGHGVGSYLSVHEGPQSISRAGMVKLEPGMICSNEPGYYKDGDYGIRIENLVLVVPAAVPDGGERPMLSFETLTLVPLDRALIDTALLTPDERNWIDGYHARVAELISPEVDAPTRDWLTKATRPL